MTAAHPPASAPASAPAARSGRADLVETVRLGARSYDVVVGDGLLDRAGGYLAPLLRRPLVAVVADATARKAHGARLAAGLDAAGVRAAWIDVPPGEASKSFGELERVLDALIEAGIERGDLVVAFGGGVVGDLAGLAASLLRRGCRFAQAPTSLLAQVDSSVGGKTAINVRRGKNLVGAFHQPAIVLADIDALATLPARELRAGYAEIVKYGALGDAAFFAWLEAHGPALLAGDAAARREAVARSVRAKAGVVARDERETGERALLNLGHTFGHALEAAYGYDGALLHGEAVAAGMGLAFDWSAREGLCAPADAARLKAHLAASGLPTGLGDLPLLPTHRGPRLDADALVSLMMQDKKVSDGRITLILARGIGAAFVSERTDAGALRAFLAEALGACADPSKDRKS